MGNLIFGLEELFNCFQTLEPLELKGMELLREQPHYIGGFAQVPRAELVEAVTEIVAYTGRCAMAAHSLAHLKPIPILTASVWEFGV
jgi:hypothetical protein